MNCDFAEKVSMLIDGELPATEIESVRAHLEHCAECRSLKRDFLFFREQIKTSVSEKFAGEQVEISPVPIKKQTRIWSGWVSLPAPALALFVFALICLGAWFAISRFSRTSIDTASHTQVKNTAPKTAKAPTEVSLTRYDTGGRAEIYVVLGQMK